MPYPKGLAWENGTATDGQYGYILCAKCKPRFYRRLEAADRRFQEKDEHDRRFHGADSGEAPALLISDMLSQFRERLALDERAGNISHKTTRWYDSLLNNLERHLPLTLPAERAGKKVMEDYVKKRLGDGTSGGASILQELGALKTAAKSFEVAYSWMPSDFRINRKPRARRAITLAEVLRWISHMQEPERTICRAKLATAAHDVELFSMRISAVKWEREGWVVGIRKKKDGRVQPHFQSLSKSLLKDLRRLAGGRPKHEHLFRTAYGSPITNEAIQYRLGIAGFNAGLTCGFRENKDQCGCDPGKPCGNPPLRRIGFLRHLAITCIVAEKGVEEAMEYVGHEVITTTMRYNRPDVFADLGLKFEDRKKGTADFMGTVIDAIPARPVKAIKGHERRAS